MPPGNIAEGELVAPLGEGGETGRRLVEGLGSGEKRSFERVSSDPGMGRWFSLIPNMHLRVERRNLTIASPQLVPLPSAEARRRSNSMPMSCFPDQGRSCPRCCRLHTCDRPLHRAAHECDLPSGK